MKLKVTTIAPCRQRLEIQLPPPSVTQAYDAVYRQIQREATLPGFRKGKAPRDLLEQHHGQAAREEVVKRLVNEGLTQAAQEHHLQLVGRCDISGVQLDEHTGLHFTAEVETAPEITPGRYKDVQLRRPSTVVSDEELNQALATLQERHAELVPTGSGEEKTTERPPLDDAFAKDLGFETLEQLRAKVRVDLTTHREEAAKRAIEQQLFDALLAGTQFDVPASLVEHEIARIKQDLVTRLLLRGVPEDKVKQELEPLERELAANAEQQVKLRFLLDRIADEERVSVTQEELVARLWQLSQQTRQDPQVVRRRLAEQGLWEGLAAEVRRQKTMDFLMRAAKIEDATSVASRTSSS